MVHYKLVIMVGGECIQLPSSDAIDPISHDNLVDLIPQQRITVGTNCYDVKHLFKWIHLHNDAIQVKNPMTNLPFSNAEIDYINTTYYNLPLDQIDIDLINRMISKNEYLYLGLPQRIQDIEQLARTAVSLNANLYMFMSESLKKNKDIAKVAFNLVPMLLEYAPTEIKDDEEIIKMAYEKNKNAINYASPRLITLLKK